MIKQSPDVGAAHLGRQNRAVIHRPDARELPASAGLTMEQPDAVNHLLVQWLARSEWI